MWRVSTRCRKVCSWILEQVEIRLIVLLHITQAFCSALQKLCSMPAVLRICLLLTGIRAILRDWASLLPSNATTQDRNTVPSSCVNCLERGRKIIFQRLYSAAAKQMSTARTDACMRHHLRIRSAGDHRHCPNGNRVFGRDVANVKPAKQQPDWNASVSWDQHGIPNRSSAMYLTGAQALHQVELCCMSGRALRVSATVRVSMEVTRCMKGQGTHT
jgi:hypothetical protein